ncbi:MAG TPA: MBL fold metallo-hydrolase, partial [Desulfosalsimonadaceae bacterium]|nr:MBL fold metallo-hydrolase [Desulfosalsimonadaceae bacterium]
LTCRKMQRPRRITPYQHLVWGTADAVEALELPDCFEKGGLRLHPVFTPGHSMDHTAFLEPQQGWLFSGDLYLAPRIRRFRNDENIALQIRSLQKILEYDFEALFCAHQPATTKGRRRIAAKLRFLENFYNRVAELADQGLDAKAIMKRLHLQETRWIQWMSLGTISMKNMVQSVVATRLEERSQHGG